VFYTPNRKFLGIYENPFLEHFKEHFIRKDDDSNTKGEKTKFKSNVGHDDRQIRRKFENVWKVEWLSSNYGRKCVYVTTEISIIIHKTKVKITR
jgi:hypothetical protein